ncbi:SGNH/GDSL hydrolase family protein [Malikia sp.]|uniref:SGNH/GDSL hydrolase family protein n=1 Tax=Malikia sp. TaxID=2070706 RepID=UPI00261A0337|nr:SGNH/GDSL hydrolase family protein [Malikia sp.]MDD2728161.1 hypothetical protein [Malikia sp.]
MAILKTKRSTVAGVIPAASSIVLGELALNTEDGHLYAEKLDGTTVQRIGTTADRVAYMPAGTGAVATNVQEKLREICDLITYTPAANIALIPRTISSALYSIGDSQTRGSNAATGVYYTDGVGRLLPQYRWPHIVADLLDNAMTVSNFAIGGQRLGWNASGGAQWSIFNQMGNLGPYAGAAEAPYVICVMGGWNSVNPYSTTEEFYKIVRRSHEANIARLLVDHWGGISHLGWADPILGGKGVGSTPGFVTTAGLSESIQDTVATDKMSFNPFYYGDTTGGRWVTRLTNGQYSQITLSNQRSCAVFLETDPSLQGIATITVNGATVATVNCYWTSAFNDDRWPMVVWIENLPASANIRVTCETGGTKSVRLLAFGWAGKDSGVARRRTIIYGSTVANSANQHDPTVLYTCAKQAEAAAGMFSEYGVFFANPFNNWIEAEDQEPQDISHLTPAGNIRVAKAFLTAKPFPFMPSNSFIKL